MISSIHIPRRFVRHSWGGTETVVLESVKRLNSLGHRASIFTSSALSDTSSEDIEGVKVRRFPHFYPYFGLSDEQRESLDHCGGNLFSWPLMRALQASKQTQLLHLHTGKRMGGIARTIARFRRIPYVLSLHGGLLCRPTSERARQESKTARTLEWGKALGLMVGSRKVLDQASAVLCLTKAEKRALEDKQPGIRCRILPNGVDLGRFKQGEGRLFRESRGLSKSSRLLGVVGRIDPQKGQLTALRALSLIEDAHLLLVGPVTDSRYGKELAQMVQELGLADRITILPGLSGQELVDAYHACDLLVIPSTHEPFGIVALEAWASGTPVVASRVGGLEELINDGHDGAHFEPLDWRGLARLTNRLLGSPDALSRLAGRGLKTVQGYSWKAHTERLVEIYQEVLCEHSVR